MEKGDIFDNNGLEYVEYLEPRGETEDLVIFYRREMEKPYKELKILGSVPRGFLESHFRKIGPNEKKRLLIAWMNARQIIPPEFQSE